MEPSISRTTYHDSAAVASTRDNYATYDTSDADDAGKRVALVLQPRHICSWVGDSPFLFINNFYHLDRAAATSIQSSFKSSPSIFNLLLSR